MRRSRTGENNTAVGAGALYHNTTGSENTAVGENALSNIIGNYNTAIGRYAGTETNTGETFTTGTTSVYIGTSAKASANGVSNEIAIGFNSNGSGSNTFTLGNPNITQLRCQVTSITALSDRRIKEDIEPADLDMCLADVRRLPIHRYKYKDFTGTHLDKHVTGFMADDVEEVFPKAVSATDQYFPVLDADGNPEMETVERQIETGADEEGNPTYTTKTEEREKRFLMEQVKDITMTEALPTLWGAVQKLAAIVEAQAAEIAELKGGVA